MILDKLKAKLTKPKPNPLHAKKITELGLTDRTYHCLRRAGIEVVGDLVQLSRKDIKGYRGVVRATCVEVEKVLKGLGLRLKEDK